MPQTTHAGGAIDIVCLGEALGEFNQTTKGDPRYLFGHGGDTSNVAIAAARSGARAAFASAVGDDMAGHSLLDLWRREGVDISAVTVNPGAPTGIYFVSHGEQGHSFSYLRAGSAASRLGPADLPLDLITGARVLHVSGISQAISASACDLVFAAIAAARKAGVTVSYDTNFRPRLWPLDRARAVTNAAMRLCHIALPGLDDARELTGASTPDAICDVYLDGGCGIVALTLGKDGVLVATPGERRRIASIRVDAVDATGAGDCFDGAFLAEWVRTGDPFQAGRYGAAAAALSTTAFGAVGALPSRTAVEAALTAG